MTLTLLSPGERAALLALFEGREGVTPVVV